MATPRWYRFAPFLGPAPDLTDRQWRVLAMVSAVSFFEHYDVYLFALNLKQIQADLAMPESQLGLLGAVVRAGAFLAVLFAFAADRFGRRQLLLITVAGYTVLTGLTALAPNTETFVALQFFARGFAVAEIIIAAVVIAEEFGPRHRGWGIGALAALQGVGAGFAAFMYGFVDVIPYGWRALYMIGLIPLALIMYWRRNLPETGRFVALRERGGPSLPLLDSLRSLIKTTQLHTTALFAAVFGFGIAAGATGFFAPKYLQDVHHWSPASVALLNVVGGALAVVGNPLAGSLSDRYGRRPVTVIFATAFAFFGIIFYSAAGMLVPLLWVGLIFFVMGTDVTLTSYGTELFATRHRSTATGLRSLVATIASIVSLAAVSGLYLLLGSNWTAVAVLCGAGFTVPIIVWLFLPETARRTLEDIAPDEQDATRNEAP